MRGVELRPPWLWIVLFITVVLILTVPLGLRSVRAQDVWQIGETVGLREGTCIREGPGFDYRAHTRVPEDEWMVMVIDGPRFADGLTWYDTSRRAASDPSGGTGWVAISLTDICPEGTTETRPSTQNPDTQESLIPSIDLLFRRLFDVPTWMAEFRLWWQQQSSSIKWVIAVVVLIILVWLWFRFGRYLFLFVEFYLAGALFWWLANKSRATWEPTWWDIAGADAPDLAILVALLPLVFWLVPRLMRVGSWMRR